MSDAYLLMASFLAMELLAVGLIHSHELLGLHELGTALRLLPLAWVVAAPIATLAGAVYEGIATVPFFSKEVRTARVVVALTFAGAALALEVAASRLGAGPASSKRWVLAVLALISAGAVSLSLPRSAGRKLHGPIGALVLFTLSAAIAPRTTDRLSLSDNVRRVYGEGAVLLGRVVELSAVFSPPPSLEAPKPVASEAPVGLDLQGTDLLLITLHRARRDHFGVYGYDRPTSPNIDRIAKTGVVFDEAYVPTPDATFALASLMTGKYMRPLTLEGFGADSDTFAESLGRYEFKTAAFYPMSIFADAPRELEPYRDAGYGFAERRVSPTDAATRGRDVVDYFAKAKGRDRLFVWAELDDASDDAQSAPFGDRDIDRYDAGIARMDAAVGEIVDGVLAKRPKTLVVIAADQGAAFDEHGGRDRGSLVYDEDVRVPLIVIGGGLVPGHVRAPASIVDLFPTVLRALDIPRPARLRGQDLGSELLLNEVPGDDGFAFSESDAMTMVAEDAFRLVCFRRAGSCELYNVRRDPGETRDVTGNHPDVVARLRSALTEVESSESKFETRGVHGSTRAWPEALERGIAGDGEAAEGVAALLRDPDVEVRRKAAAVLFELRRPEAAAALKLALARDQDPEVRDYASLALTRLGEGSPRTRELLLQPDRNLRRMAALALAESGDDHGANELVTWWRSAYPHDAADASTPIEVARAKEILHGFSKTKLRPAIIPLIDSLRDPRIRAFVAAALADIGDDAARVPLSDQLLTDQDAPTRAALVDALLRLKAGAEIVKPLTAVLGLPDPVPRGLEAALKTKMLQHVGGPVEESENARMKRFATTGVSVDFFVPKVEVDRGVRAICLARSEGEGEIRIGRRLGFPSSVEKKSPIPTEAPPLDPAREVTIKVGGSPEPVQVYATLPPELDVHPGKPASLVVFATQKVTLEACALVPLRSDLQGLSRTDD